MESDQILDIVRQALRVGVFLAAPLLVFGLVAGVLINIFQAVTQINENTLAIVPKMLAIMLALLLFAPWMIDLLTDFTTELFTNIPVAVR